MQHTGDESGESDTAETSTCCKVTATAAAYGTHDAVSELATRREDGASFRELATYFNTRVTEQALKEAGVQQGQSVYAALIGEDFAPTVYGMLRTDEGSDVKRAELRARLSDEGVDVDALEEAFVSHVTIRSHLQECVGARREKSSSDFEKTVNTVRWAHTRAENIIQNALDSAVTTQEVETGELETEVVVRVTCESCGDTFYVEELLDERQCSCAENE